MGDSSATGVAFSRNPSTGVNKKMLLHESEHQDKSLNSEKKKITPSFLLWKKPSLVCIHSCLKPKENLKDISKTCKI
jgi:phosphoenolpyruvate synthase/pyruvate phosphate dikinase